MVRKLIYLFIPLFLLCCPLFILCCASVEAPEPSAPAVEPVKIVNPEIKIDFTKPEMASVSVYYRADNWAFIDGVELKNGAGETRRYTFKKPRRTVWDNGTISEFGVVVLQDWDIDGVVSTAATKLRDFVAVGDVSARPLADIKYFDFSPVEIIGN